MSAPAVSPNSWDAPEIAALLPYLTDEEQAELDGLLEPSTEDRSDELARCAADPVFWVNTYAVTYDPRLLPEDPYIPFHLFPRQGEFLEWLQAREAGNEDGLAEKSRDVGFTWLCCAYAVHGWLFRPGFKAGFGSRKLDLVDRIGDPDSIFEKIRILIRHLPPWMLPRGWKEDKHAGYCKILNPENGASITGEGGDNIGRGGRCSIYFIDEAAHLEHPQLVEASLSATTRVRIWVSTPNGPGNPFAKKRFSGKIAVFTFHWRDDPRKDDAWYEAEKVRLGDPVIVAQEIDIDYNASVEGVTIPAAWVRAAVELDQAVGYCPLLSPTGGLDIGEEGPDDTVLVPRNGPVVRTPQEFPKANTTRTAWLTRDAAEKLGITLLHYDCVGVGAGVKGTWESAETPLPFVTNAIQSGAAPTETRWPNGKTSRQWFLNFRAELWWLVRARFEKAYEYRMWLEGKEGGKEHPFDEMISLPNHSQLIAELSLPLYETTDTDKIKIESKRDMKKRGVKSPNFADALIYSFAPGRRELRVY